GVRIENTPPYRGDAKGIVERHFRTIQADFKPFAPGVVAGTTIKKRGGKDYRLDATLTLDDFTKIIIGSILHRNQSSVLVKYDRDP
ncbi:transposase, partial [Vibrio cholerae]|nr:transposase [Vibrio cholerae]